MSQYDNTNQARAFPPQGLFTREGVQKLQASGKPIISVMANVDGKDVDIGLYWAMEWNDATGTYSDTQYKLNKYGDKYLRAKVKPAYVKPVDSVPVLGDVGKNDPFNDDDVFS